MALALALPLGLERGYRHDSCSVPALAYVPCAQMSNKHTYVALCTTIAYVHSGNGLPLLALRHLGPLPVSTTPFQL